MGVGRARKKGSRADPLDWKVALEGRKEGMEKKQGNWAKESEPNKLKAMASGNRPRSAWVTTWTLRVRQGTAARHNVTLLGPRLVRWLMAANCRGCYWRRQGPSAVGSEEFNNEREGMTRTHFGYFFFLLCLVSGTLLPGLCCWDFAAGGDSFFFLFLSSRLFVRALPREKKKRHHARDKKKKEARALPPPRGCSQDDWKLL